MSNDLIFKIVLLIIWIGLILAYCIFVIIDENKKYNRLQYYKKNISYEFDYDKYIKMVKKMKKVLRKKKLKLFCLKVLVFFKELITCKK